MIRESQEKVFAEVGVERVLERVLLLVDLTDRAPQSLLGYYLLLLDLPSLQQEFLRVKHLVGEFILHPAHLARRTRVLQLVSRFGRDVGLRANPKADLGRLLSLLVRSHSEIGDLEVPIVKLCEL